MRMISIFTVFATGLTRCKERSIISRMAFFRIARILLIIIIAIPGLTFSNLPPGDQVERVRAFTRDLEFDYVSWILDAFGIKLGQFSLDAQAELSSETRRQVVLDYLDLMRRIQQAEAHLNAIYASAQHLLELVDDVLDLSQIEVHRLPLVKDHIDLNTEVIDRVVSAVAATPTRLPSRRASPTMGSSIFRTGMPTSGLTVSTQGDIEEQVHWNTTAPACSAAMA